MQITESFSAARFFIASQFARRNKQVMPMFFSLARNCIERE
jgi:hypothetical protein